MTRHVIAIPTLGKRPLSALLKALQEQRPPIEPTHIERILLHNAPAHDSRIQTVAESHGARYLLVPTMGYASVRNSALDYAAHADFLTFIDDDELPSREWISTHLYEIQRWKADILLGPVDTVVPPDAPAWLDEGRLLRERDNRPDGLTDGAIFSGNTTLRLSFLNGNGLRFHQRFDLTGGEDTDFFGRCRKSGARVAWSSRVRVVEFADPDRLQLTSVLIRNFRRAALSTRMQLADAADTRSRVAVRKCAQVCRGLLRLLRGVTTRDTPTLTRGLRDIALAAGSLTGLVPYPPNQPGEDN